MDLYGSSKANISEHIKHIFEEEELEKDSVIRNFRITAADESRIRQNISTSILLYLLVPE